MILADSAMQLLIHQASRHRLTELHYRGSSTSAGPAPRVVEPYNFTQGPEHQAALDLRRLHNLSMDQVRFVHASLFHRCQGAILDAGVIDMSEQAELRFLHRILLTLGWSVVTSPDTIMS